MNSKNFGTLATGENTTLYTLSNDYITCTVSDFGSSMVNLWFKDKAGNPIDIVLGFDDVAGYENDKGAYIGCNVGRNANRVSNASFTLNGKVYELDKNEGNNNLHSGFNPYSKRMWNVEDVSDDRIILSLHSPHMDQGFPGNMDLKVTYLLKANELKITYDAICDDDTVICITNHSYFNLNGQGSGAILNHKVKLNADSFIPVDANSIPTGEIVKVAGTPMDFNVPKTIGEEIEADYEPLRNTGGYDHNWCVTDYDGTLREAVVAEGDISGVKMTISTDYPGIQMYAGNFLKGEKGKDDAIYNKREGICFEPQFYPDSVNNENFISPICKANKAFHKEIVYRFE